MARVIAWEKELDLTFLNVSRRDMLTYIVGDYKPLVRITT